MAAAAVIKMLGLAKSMLKEESALGGVFQETKNRGEGEKFTMINLSMLL